MGVAAKSPRARGKRQIRGRHLRQMVTQGFSYNGHATGFDGWENCSKAKTTWCCISLQCTVSFLNLWQLNTDLFLRARPGLKKSQQSILTSYNAIDIDIDMGG